MSTPPFLVVLKNEKTASRLFFGGSPEKGHGEPKVGHLRLVSLKPTSTRVPLKTPRQNTLIGNPVSLEPGALRTRQAAQNVPLANLPTVPGTLLAGLSLVKPLKSNIPPAKVFFKIDTPNWHDMNHEKAKHFSFQQKSTNFHKNSGASPPKTSHEMPRQNHPLSRFHSPLCSTIVLSKKQNNTN